MKTQQKQVFWLSWYQQERPEVWRFWSLAEFLELALTKYLLTWKVKGDLTVNIELFSAIFTLRNLRVGLYA